VGPLFECQTMSILTIPTLSVSDLHAARQFYVHALGCLPARLDEALPEGVHIDENDDVLPLDFMGHPLLLVLSTDKSARPRAHLPSDGAKETLAANDSDHDSRSHGSHPVADPSAAVIAFILGVDDWCTTAERLQAHNIEVTVAPSRRFSIVPGEQCAMTIHDPDGNCIEFRGFAAEEGVLAA